MPALKSLKSMPVLLPSVTKETIKPLKPLVRKKEVPVPLNIPKKMTRHATRPCGCGRHRSGCRWQIYYPENSIIAIHEVIPYKEGSYRDFLKDILAPPPVQESAISAPTPVSLTDAQDAAIYAENTRTVIEPTFTFIKKFCTLTPKLDVKAFLEDEPFATVSEDQVECVGCKIVLEYNAKAWVAHRDACEAIDERILAATVDKWAIQTSVALMRMGLPTC